MFVLVARGSPNAWELGELAGWDQEWQVDCRLLQYALCAELQQLKHIVPRVPPHLKYPPPPPPIFPSSLVLVILLQLEWP
jgi:hypothetical protein